MRHFFFFISFLFLMVFLSFCDKRPNIPSTVEPSIIEIIKSLYDSQLSSNYPNHGNTIFKSHDLSLGRVEPLWIATRQSNMYGDEEKSIASEFILPVETEFRLIFSDLKGNSFDSSNYLFVQGENCWVVTEVSLLGDIEYYRQDQFTGIRIFQFLQGDLYKIEKWNNGEVVGRFYYTDNALTDQFQNDLSDHIFYGLRISKVRGVLYELTTRSSPDSIEASYCYATYIPDDWNYPGWWNEFYFQFLSDSLLWVDYADSTECGDGQGGFNIGGGFGGGGGGGNNQSGNNNGNASGVPLPSDLSDYIGTSTYYSRRFSDYVNRYGITDSSIYYISYGKKYYDAFMALRNAEVLSSQGNNWISTTAYLLQEKLEIMLLNNPTIEDNLSSLRSAAFYTHLFAYLEAGFLDLPLSDKIKIALTIEPQDLASNEGIIQILAMGFCQISHYQSNPSAMFNDANYLMDNWLNILSDVYNYVMNTRTDIDEEVMYYIDLILGQQMQYFYENVPGFHL